MTFTGTIYHNISPGLPGKNSSIKKNEEKLRCIFFILIKGYLLNQRPIE